LAAEHASRAKDDLLDMVGHLLRNPLTPIVAALQLMRLRNTDPPSPEYRVIERQVQRMVRVLDDLLDESTGLAVGSPFTAGHDVAEPRALGPSTLGRVPSVRASSIRRILVVDDNLDAMQLLSDLLLAMGHQVAAATDAAQALQIAKGFKPQVAVLDIGLPVMDGYQLALKLKQELGPEAPELIAVTGYGQRKDRERSAQVGFRAHLVKPVELQRLLGIIDSLPD
jgi:CheY-like chemotaxis protein